MFMTDNTGVVGIVNTITSKNSGIMRLIRQLVLACLKYNISFTCRHVPGYQKVIADRLSRFQFVESRYSAPWLDVIPPDIRTYLASYISPLLPNDEGLPCIPLPGKNTSFFAQTFGKLQHTFVFLMLFICNNIF